MATELSDAIKQSIGYKFKKPGLILQALTHSSARPEVSHTISETSFLLWSKDKTIPATDNERLEFLGDAVLGLIISDILFKEFSDTPEGGLTVLKSSLVNRSTLAIKARGIGLDKLIIVGKGFSGKQLPDSLLADAMEALFGAIYLDRGIDALYKLIQKLFSPDIETSKNSTTFGDDNYKALLQDYSQRHLNCLPHYKVIRETGPKHEPTFEIVVWMGGKPYGHGMGRSKKESEQAAAKATLDKLQAARPY